MRRISSLLLVLVATVSVLTPVVLRGVGAQRALASSTSIDVTVDEGTSMSVGVSPDGQTLAIDLQGSIWTLPASGGAATRITGVFEDARQPVWSPDGRSIAFFAFHDGGNDLWTIAPDGTGQRRLTAGPFDDREPAWSHDGTRIAFSSERGDAPGTGETWSRTTAIGPTGASSSGPTGTGNSGAGNYNIWVLDLRSGALRRLTDHAAEDTMPSWSPDDREIAFASTREDGRGVWAVRVEDGVERKIATTKARIDAVSWSPGGQIVAHGLLGTSSHLEVDTIPITGDENVFPFRPSWASGTGSTFFYYVADGKIRRRTIASANHRADGRTIPFHATIQVTRPQDTYKHRVRDVDSTTPRRALGIVRPVISPDGKRIAFAALGDIYLARIDRGIDGGAHGGSTPENLTRDAALDTDPAWSPDGTRLVYSSDKPSDKSSDSSSDKSAARAPTSFLQLWIRDLKTGADRQLTTLATQPLGATWSPDGTRIAFLEHDNVWRRASVSIVDVATGRVTKIHESLFGPGTPTWSPDGTRVALAMVAPYSLRFREGSNQILSIAAPTAAPTTPQTAASTAASTAAQGGGGAPGASGSDDRWYAPVPHLSIDSRGGCGPVWSPDGTKMAAIYEGLLAVFPVSPSGEPLGPPRRVTSEMAHSPSWAGDSRHVLYQSMDALKIVDIDTGTTRDVPLSLTYTPAVPKGRIVIHARRLIDGTHATAQDFNGAGVDITIEGNRIRAVAPHTAAAHPASASTASGSSGSGSSTSGSSASASNESGSNVSRSNGTAFIDAPTLTAMPGLIEFHSHMQKDFGAAQGRAWLAFGITTVRSPGNTPYEAVEDREANEAGVRPGPRVFATGYLMEWQRAYYKMAVAISNPAHFEMELRRAQVLQHDLLKSYVRLPDAQQRRMVEFAHGIGLPVASHEIYPAAFVGVDHVEHTSATSRRGYSPKMSTRSRSYADVAQLIGQARMFLTPTLFGSGRRLIERDPALAQDPRLLLYPAWMRDQVVAPMTAAQAAALGASDGIGKMILDVHKAGGRIVAGTDTPNGLNLHGELLAYVTAGMTPFEALKAATVTPAEALGLDAGIIAPGKLADIVLVDGNPLEDITHTLRVRYVIANGRVP